MRRYANQLKTAYNMFFLVLSVQVNPLECYTLFGMLTDPIYINFVFIQIKVNTFLPLGDQKIRVVDI